MNTAITHRGPDESGWYSDEYCTLAMSRLSIIDLQQGKQPKYSPSKSSLIFFNGEIYNYRELRGSLQKIGHKFYSESDTEVLIVMYEEYGEKMLSFLTGMFTFCIYNKEKQSFFFARDRFGEKPLYYYFSNNELSFSSEVRSLLENKAIPRVLNKNVLHYYFTCSYVPEPFTLIDGVMSLPAGHAMTFCNSKITINKYFEITYTPDHSIKSLDDAVAYIKPDFENAVKNQMISDVPLGAFLSGGIDSSTVVATMQQFASKPIKTFNVKFEEASYDESKIAKEVAEFVGTDHHEIVIPNATFDQDIFWKIIDHVGLPFPDSSAIPTYYITKEIKKHVTVALSGDGGDELFGGYPLFDWYDKIIKIQNKNRILRTISSAIFRNLRNFYDANYIRQISKGLDLSLQSRQDIPVLLHSLFEKNHFNEMGVSVQSFDFLHNPHSETSTWDSIRYIMHYRIKHNLPLDMLTKVDRMSMANSLEVRTPFLDHCLFDKSSKLPSQFLRKNGVGKLVLREMMKSQLPQSVFDHPKSGFSIPLHKYQNKHFKDLANELLFSKRVLSNTVNMEYIKKLSKSVLSDNRKVGMTKYQSSHQLWSLLQLAGWIKRFDIEA